MNPPLHKCCIEKAETPVPGLFSHTGVDSNDFLLEMSLADNDLLIQIGIAINDLLLDMGL